MKTTSQYCVIEVSGRQYLVRDGDIITTERIDGEVEKDFEIKNVLLSVNDSKIEIGEPYLKGSVSATLMKNLLGTKVKVSKFKAKTGYRRTNGYRSSLSQIRINKIV